MTRPVSFALLLAVASAAAPSALWAQFGIQQHPVEVPAPPPITALDDIRYLADDGLAGRLTGTPGADSAAAYLARRFAQVGLQPAKGGRSGTATAQQKREIEQIQLRRLGINKELRDVQHQLNAEIDALGLRLKFINIVLVPALVVLLGLLYGWRRTRYSRRRR